MGASVCAGAVATGCLDRPLCAEDCDPKTTNIFVDQLPKASVDKIDLLFMIDNSASMADKQQILQDAVPDLVRRLVNPVCVNEETGEQIDPPTDAEEPCAAPYTRQFKAIKDIHIGVISSSLGGFGGSRCEATEQENDRGRLVGARPRALDLALANAPEGLPGFLDWNPESHPGATVRDFTDTFEQLVIRVGEVGCGFEASLEAWYRFLIDPVPPERIDIVPCDNGSPCASPSGRDQALLDQRAQFLRPDSLVAIIMLTDENDCSIQNSGQAYYAADPTFALPRSRSECALDPNHRCCESCGAQFPREDCPPDPSCSAEEPVEDPLNLRCFKQKERFGADFLYPIERYVNALTQHTLCPERPDLSLDGCGEPHRNPLFSVEVPRGAGLVFLAGIVGVPWQDIARNPDPNAPLEYKTVGEMTADRTWDVILGDPKASPPVAPYDPLMVESIDPRSGSTYATNEPLTVNAGTNQINGHEWIPTPREDLQYACIFPRPEVTDCSLLSKDDPRNCDCKPDRNPEQSMNPLCQQNGSAPYGSLQYHAKAYPGLRHLQVLKDFGKNSIVASICARNVGRDDASRMRQDYGYRPAIAAIVDRLKDALNGKCLPRQLDVDDNGDVPCSVIEAASQPGLGCARPGRKDPRPDVLPALFTRLERAGHCGGETGRPCNESSFTLCEISPSKADENGDGFPDCRQDLDTVVEAGYCYVDPARGAELGVFLGDEALVSRCPATERRLLNFVGDDMPAKNSVVLIACLGAEIEDTLASPPPEGS